MNLKKRFRRWFGCFFTGRLVELQDGQDVINAEEAIRGMPSKKRGSKSIPSNITMLKKDL